MPLPVRLDHARVIRSDAAHVAGRTSHRGRPPGPLEPVSSDRRGDQAAWSGRSPDAAGDPVERGEAVWRPAFRPHGPVPGITGWSSAQA